MRSPLISKAQDDFSAGLFPDGIAASEGVAKIPPNGLNKIQNGLIDDDGAIFRRGGSEYLSTAAFGASGTFLWDGWLTPGRRTVMAHATAFGALGPGEVPVNLGGAGLQVPRRAVELGGLLFIPDLNGALYGGSFKTAPYSTGTVTVTNGSAIVTGAGTLFSANVDAGMLLRIGGVGRYYVVVSVDSNTQLTLRDPYEGVTAAGAAYTLSQIVGAMSAPYRASQIYAVAANRLFSIEGNFIRFTPRNSPHSFAATDFHVLPRGTIATGAIGLGDSLLIFASNGLWRLDGIALSIVDALGNPQHRLRKVSDHQLVAHEGLIEWVNMVIAPCADGIWLLDGISEPVRISEPIDHLWRSYLSGGWKPGIPAVARGHLFLPVIDTFGNVVDQLVCRLDRPLRPWTHFNGYGGNVKAWALRSGVAGQEPFLLGSSAANGRVLKGNAFFNKVHMTWRTDADGSTHQFQLATRLIPVVDGYAVGTVKEIQVRYELLDDATSPIMTATAWADGTDSAALWKPGGGPQAPKDSGSIPFIWRTAKRARFMQIQLSCIVPCSSLVIRSIKFRARPSDRSSPL